MNFAQDRRDMNSGPPKSFQIVAEVVVGVAGTGKKSYTVYNFTFDGVSLYAGASKVNTKS